MPSGRTASLATCRRVARDANQRQLLGSIERDARLRRAERPLGAPHMRSPPSRGTLPSALEAPPSSRRASSWREMQTRGGCSSRSSTTLYFAASNDLSARHTCAGRLRETRGNGLSATLDSAPSRDLSVRCTHGPPLRGVPRPWWLSTPLTRADRPTLESTVARPNLLCFCSSRIACLSLRASAAFAQAIVSR